ncbi:MFS transporter [Xenorhabdus doucetiae]|uniref:MFS family arabinose efflux permease n=1 Tax=Xenorhabdus doucetiae TaxID=351671 RepID=A0A068QQJ2_9GAMM|nr:MFS transporter [Xenorhabdus doucetiae]TYP16430.1 putative MFS family arabinose efflux permease [Xenorhabdus doucetiae]CDG16916.1 Transporter [Xenorhabdus doucetiae]
MINFKNNIAVFLLGSCALICLYSTQPVLGNIALWANVSMAKTALTISATTLGVAVVAPFSGLTSDYFGRKRVIVTAITLLFLITLIAIFAWNFTSLLVFRFLQGLTIPFIFSSTIAYIAEQWEGNESTKLNSIYVAGTAFGGFSGRFFSGVTSDLYGSWQSTFVALAAILFIILIVVAKFLPKERNFVRISTSKEIVNGLLVYVKDKKILITCFIAFVLLFQQVSSFTFGSLLLAKPPFNLSLLETGFIFIVFLIPSIITPIMSTFINKLGYIWAFTITCLLGVSGLILTLLPNTIAVITGLSLSCISVFFGQSCGTSFIAKYCKVFKSSAVGLYLFFYYMGGCFGGIIPAKIYEYSGWNSCIYLLIGLIILSLVLSTFGWKEEKKANV